MLFQSLRFLLKYIIKHILDLFLNTCVWYRYRMPSNRDAYITKARLLEEELKKNTVDTLVIEGNTSGTQYVVTVHSTDAVITKRTVFSVLLTNAQKAKGYANGDVVIGEYDNQMNGDDTVYFSLELEDIESLKALMDYMYSWDDCSLKRKSPFMEGFRKAKAEASSGGGRQTPGQQGLSTQINTLTEEKRQLETQVAELTQQVATLTQQVATLTTERTALIEWGRRIRQLTAPRSTPQCLLPVHN